MKTANVIPINRPRIIPNLPVLHAVASVRYKTQIINPDGSVASERPFKNNLILDQGLNLHASYTWAQCFEYCAIGTGTNPVKWDSATTTASRSGTTVTSSANFFSAGDVGRLLKFDSGEETYITAYTDPVTVTVADSGTVASAEFTIYGVNQTALQTETKRTNTYNQDGGDNQSTYNSGTATWTHKRTYLFAAETGSVTYREIGWSPVSSANLFGRDLIPGSGDSLVSGQQYKVIMQLTVAMSPTSPQAVSDVGNNGFNTAGNAMLESLRGGVSIVNSNGSSDGFNFGQYRMEPSASTSYLRISVVTATWTQQSSINTGEVNISVTSKTPSRSSYSNGNFYVDWTATFGVSEGNGNIFGLAIGGGTDTNFTVKFTSTQTKDSSHTLTVVFRYSWQRNLTN